MTTVVILQPGYIPWLGFFEQMHRCDVFVYYDDVQFDKHGWRNRNRVKGPQGVQWLTIPVLHGGRGWPAIHEIEIDRRVPWARKHMATIAQCYARAPYLKRYLPELEEVLLQDWQRLVEVDLEVTDVMCRWLDICRPIVRSSELGIGGDRSERLLNICRHLNATRYLSGSAARDYLDVELFAEHGIEVAWQDYQHPTYKQLHGDFIPYLSTLDLLLNCGDDSGRILTHQMAGV
ncbi:MAG TPA: WbqC family protein [Chloroflexota bacterium]